MQSLIKGSRHPILTWTTLVILALALGACGAEEPLSGPAPDPDPVPEVGLIQVSTSTTGGDLDPNGYKAAMDAGAERSIGLNGVTTFTDVATGPHQVELTDLADNCSVTGDNPVAVTVSANATAQAGFSITCQAHPIGNLELIATVTNNLDPDGFFVYLDGALSDMLPANGAITIAALDAGDHQVALSGVAPNCALEGSNPRTVTVPDGGTVTENFTVTCTPPADGRIVFYGGGRYDVWVSNIDGTGVTNLSNNSTVADIQPAWSPDGSQVAFASDRDGGDYDIYVMNQDASGLVRLTTDPHTDREPAWSPDGTRLAFVSERDGSFAGEIFIINADGSGLVQLTADDGGTDAVTPTWSADGTRIAFIGASFGEDENLFSIAVDGTDLRRLTGPAPICPQTSRVEWVDMQPDWSPDGSRIAFLRWDDCGGDGHRLMTMNADGTDLMDITPVGVTDLRSVAWSPDGTQLVAGGGASAGFWIMNADGSAAVHHLSGTSAYEPDWGP